MPVCPVHIVVIADNVSTMHVNGWAYNSSNVFTCPCQPVNHGSTTHAYSVTYPFDCVSLLSAFRRPKTIHKCLRRRSRNQILNNQRQNSVNVWLIFLMAQFDGTATKRTYVDVSDVLINVASDWSDHQCCGSYMALALLLLLCQLGRQKWKVFQCCCRCTRTGSEYSECACCSEDGKISKVLVISIILVLVLVSFCWIILVII